MTAPRRVQRFVVISHLGTGGMGSVYRAHDPQLERDVAIKLLTPSADLPAELSQSETLDLRGDAPASANDLLQEARMMARLSHPNVLPVYEVGLAEGAVFVVMEHIDGCNLRTWLAQPRTTAEILEVFRQAGLGLAAAHAEAIVHRDFKPENVLVGVDGRIRVADFGLSRLTSRPANAMVRVVDGRGTPQYMAPELWRGVVATQQSDVFAFCVALAEALGAEPGDRLDQALRAREVAAPLRAAIAAGLAEDASARPALEDILAAIENRPAPRRRPWLLIAGCGALVVGVGITLAAMTTTHAAPSCDADPGIAAGRWDDVRRAAMKKLVEPKETAALHGIVAKILATFDEDQQSIDDQWRATCVAARDGSVSEAGAQIRRSCIERRQFELAALVDQVLSAKRVELGRLLEKSRISDVADCVDTTAPPIKQDRGAVIALYKRYAETDDMPKGPARVAAFEKIERDAAASGERELQARAALAVGTGLQYSDQIAAGDAALQRAYGLAIELRSTRLQAVVLIERSGNATMRGDMQAAVSLGELALAFAEKVSTSPGARAYVFSVLGHAALQRGAMLGALDLANKGLDIVAKDGHRLPTTEMTLRLDQTMALMNLEGRMPEAVKRARDLVEYARGFDVHSRNYAIALTLLGQSLQSTDRDASLNYKLEALGIMTDISPAGSSDVEIQRLDTASALLEAGRFEEARQACATALEASEHNDALRSLRPAATAYLGEATVELGRFDEGIPIVVRSLELLASQYGMDHVLTQAFRKDLIAQQLEVGRLDDAERNIAILDRSYRTRAEPNDQRLAYLHGFLGAQLALQRGHAREAETLARSGVATLDEMHGDADDRIRLLRILGAALIAQRQWARAREPLDKALALAHSRHLRDDVIAQLEIELARVEAGLGQRDRALALARGARDVLDKYPGAVIARREADAVLAAKPAAPARRANHR